MSIVTRTGDDGTTALMYGRRVPKHHPRIRACGSVDELNGALGLARAGAEHDFVRGSILAAQNDLVALMGELATVPEDMGRYTKDGFALLTADKTQRLDLLARQIEEQQVYGKGWTMPGDNLDSAALDYARTVCRRCERDASELVVTGSLNNPEILIFLNRLSDVLWLLARWVEAQHRREKSDGGGSA
jgi:cob(I)alamin adenosyltransferase